MDTQPEIPDRLIEEIHAGECVAFVGAGFSAAAKLPSWGQLLSRIAKSKSLPAPIRAHVEERICAGSGHAYDEAAQVLQDAMKPGLFLRSLRRLLGSPKLTPTMRRRVDWLRGIPFRAILTTNFDGLLEGSIPDPKAYREILRSSERWWDERHWLHAAGAPTIKLHGDLNRPESIVLSRVDYRRRLYANAAYMGFLRAVLAQRTVLYLGFSFADAYLNELRSEALALLGSGEPPVAYAVLADLPGVSCRHLLKNEGIHALNYTVQDGDHSGFDAVLKAIHDRANPAVRFGRLLAGKRILWLDRQASRYDHHAVLDFLQTAAKSGEVHPAEIEHAYEHEAAIDGIEKRQKSGKPFDLVITRWGHGESSSEGGKKTSIGVRLLSEVRRRNLLVPVIVFAGAAHAEENKREAMRLGSQGFHWTLSGLLRGIERAFAHGETI